MIEKYHISDDACSCLGLEFFEEIFSEDIVCVLTSLRSIMRDYFKIIQLPHKKWLFQQQL